jgi:hypothetical protein
MARTRPMLHRSEAPNLRREQMTKTARKTAAKETIVDTITQRMANVANVIRNGDWTYTDTLAFHRVKMLEKMADQLAWSVTQTEEYSAKQRDRVKIARQRYTGDEISTTQLQGAIAEAQAASLNHDITADLLADILAQIEADTGKTYTPFRMTRTSNLRQEARTSSLPADLAAQLAALGIDDADGATVANTRGTSEEGFTA